MLRTGSSLSKWWVHFFSLVCTTLENDTYMQPLIQSKILKAFWFCTQNKHNWKVHRCKISFFWTSTYLFWGTSEIAGICKPKNIKFPSYNEIQQDGETIMPFENPSLKCFGNWKSMASCNDAFLHEDQILFTVLVRQLLPARKKNSYILVIHNF